MVLDVYNSPKTIAEETVGEFILTLNDWGEITISNKYEPTSFVFSGDQAKEFVYKLNHLYNKRKN